MHTVLSAVFWGGAHLGPSSSVSSHPFGWKAAAMPAGVHSKPVSSGSPLAFIACMQQVSSFLRT